MPPTTELTLQQLLQIALGAPQLTNVNITILHSLIGIILKKLNCQEEKVSIGGYESKCLEKILETSKISTLPFNDEKVELISEKLDRLAKLERRLECVSKKLENHFEEIRQCSDMADTTFHWANWEHYAAPCEDLCTTCDEKNSIACSLIKNTDFLKKLLRRVSTPLVERMFEFERKIEELHDEFVQFLRRADEEYGKIALIERCIYEVEMLRDKVDAHQLQFLGTMEEVQEMLDAKLDKLHIPALKKYLKGRFDEIEASVGLLQAEKNCPVAAGIIMEGIKCLSCGGEKVCAPVGEYPISSLPPVHPKKPTGKRSCGCIFACREGAADKTLKERMAMIDIDVVRSLVNIKDNKRKSCKLPDGSFPLLEGTDGNLYRKG